MQQLGANMSKGTIAIHKLKGEHKWDILNGLYEECSVCGASRKLSDEPIFREDREAVYLPEKLSTQAGLREICKDNFNLYNRPIRDILVTPPGAEQLGSDYMGESRFMSSMQNPNFRDRNRGRGLGNTAYQVTNPVTGDAIRVNIVRDEDEALELLEGSVIQYSPFRPRPFKAWGSAGSNKLSYKP